MKTRLQWIIILGGGLMFGVSLASAGSIWAKAQRGTRPLHTDDTARQIGDVLTIIISEHSVVENETERTLEKTSSRDFSASGSLPTDESSVLKQLNWLTGRLLNLSSATFEMDAENTFEGTADYDSARSITDRITATVVDVLPNGSLVVVGSRSRGVARDTQIVEVSGIVRPSDLTFANTVTSDKIADFRLLYRHKGHENKFINPGWLEWVMNVINPF